MQHVFLRFSQSSREQQLSISKIRHFEFLKSIRGLMIHGKFMPILSFNFLLIIFIESDWQPIKIDLTRPGNQSKDSCV